jgi:phage recombination protein Bet
MNVPAKIEKPMLLEVMADKYGLKPQEFADTVRKTCGMPTASAEEFAAFLMVCRQYDLNPILREVYAFPKRGGGIVPIVGIDGWLNLINGHPQCDGFDFTIEHDQQGELVSITCRLYRKDRAHPVEVTEYLSECIRPTDPWKMKHRMLRHKTLMQAARYAFGFSGIYDEDEGVRIAEAPMRDISDRNQPTVNVPLTPPKPPSRPTPPQPPKPPVKGPKPEVKGPKVEEEVAFDDAVKAPGDLLSSLDAAFDEAQNAEEIEDVWNEFDLMAQLENLPQGEQFQGVALSIKRKHLARFA